MSQRLVDDLTQVEVNNQRVLVGKHALEGVHDLAKRMGIRRPFVLTSPTVSKNEIVANLISRFPNPNSVAVHSTVSQHAPVTCVLTAIESFRSFGGDGIIAIGGGSVMDVAKLVSFDARVGGRIADVMNSTEGGRISLADSYSDEELGIHAPLPCIAIPTTLSTAEYTQSAGFTTERFGKVIVDHPEMRLSAVILDAALARTTPPRVWNSSAVKAIDTGIGSLAGLGSQDGVSGALVESGLRLLWAILTRTHSQGDDLAQINTLQCGAWMALFPRWLGRSDAQEMLARRDAMSIWPSAAFRHQLGGVLGLPHSEMSAAVLPAMIGRIENEHLDFSRRLCQAMSVADGTLQAAVIECISSYDLPTRLSDLGVTEEDLDRVSVSIELESGGKWEQGAAMELLLAAL